MGALTFEISAEFKFEIKAQMQLTVLLMMASGTLGLPNRLNPFLPIHDLFSAAQIDKLNSIVDQLNKMEPMMFHNLPHKREVSELDSLDDESDLNDFMKLKNQNFESLFGNLHNSFF